MSRYRETQYYSTFYVEIALRHGALSLCGVHSQESYKPKPPATELAPFIVAHAVILHGLLAVICGRILQVNQPP
jgi:hypothetical protein